MAVAGEQYAMTYIGTTVQSTLVSAASDYTLVCSSFAFQWKKFTDDNISPCRLIPTASPSEGLADAA